MALSEFVNQVNPITETWEIVQAYCASEIQEAYERLDHERDAVITAEIRGRVVALKEVLELAGVPRLKLFVEPSPPEGR